MNRKDYYPGNDFSLNADDVSFRMQYLRMSDLLAMIDNHKLDLFDYDAELSKYLNAWDITRKSLFIESLMIKIPTPLFYIDGSQPTWKIIDGIKRLFAVWDFVRGKYKLSNLQFLGKECEGCYFSDLYGYLASRIMDAEIRIDIINPGTPQRVRYNIYQRLNLDRRGISWNKIQHVFFRELSTGFFKPLVESPPFAELSTFYYKSQHLEARRFAMKFIAFSLFGYESYKGDIETFISEALFLLQSDTHSLPQWAASFCKGSERMLHLFNNNKDEKKSVLPHSIMLDAFLSTLSQLTQYEADLLMRKKELFISEYEMFERSNNNLLRTSSAHLPYEVRMRFESVRNLIKKYID